MRLIFKIMIAIIAVVMLGAVACVALVGGAVHDIQKNAEEKAISKEEFKDIKMGVTIKEFKGEFGEPEDAQQTKTKGLKMDCIYYPMEGGEITDLYQFCFSNGKLDSKARY